VCSQAVPNHPSPAHCLSFLSFTLPLSAIYRGFSFFPSRFISSCIATQRSVFTLFRVFLSVHISFLANEGQYGHYNHGYSPYPATNPYDQLNYYAQDSFSHPQDNQSRPLSTGYPPHGQEYRSSYPRSLCSPIRAVSLTKLPRNTRHDLLSSSFSSRAISATPATATLSAAARCFRAWPVSQYFRPQRPPQLH